MEDIHLSVVAGSRNDDHGGKLLYRMQHFVTGFIQQCEKHHLSAELILVDWNPPDGKPSLSEILKFPESKSSCKVRIITVPKEIHDTLSHAKELPMFQMIAKNVGIRRAKGKYILATNIDVLFSDELILYLRDHLKVGRLYRADRLDVPSELPDSDSIDPILDYCVKNYFRINGRYGTQILKNEKWSFVDTSSTRHSKKLSSLKNNLWTFYLRKLLLMFNPGNRRLDFGFFQHLYRRIKFRFILNAHTNACGDFTLLSSEDWDALRGYPELQGFSWHLDAFLIYQARLSGIQHEELSREKSVYHIEHGKSSGYTPESHDLVFDRIKAKKIPCLDDRELLKMVALMKKKKENYAYNDDRWGFSNYEFKEVVI